MKTVRTLDWTGYLGNHTTIGGVDDECVYTILRDQPQNIITCLHATVELYVGLFNSAF